MTCAELRRALGTAGPLTPKAEDHLAGCAACFAWLERTDPLLGAFREARPPEAAPARSLADRVLDSWQPRTPPLSAHPFLGLGAAAVLAAACACALMILAAVAGSHLGVVPGLLARDLGSLTAPVSTPAGLLLDHPGLMGGLVGLAAAAAWAWSRIDRRLRSGPWGTG
ncbi:MAG: hypothetical protein J2P45_19675 [Candidatus Dormibacteraeota bacterium]|nr:hypothetical protein [Candidatus Dormibacteraeota bacterium]